MKEYLDRSHVINSEIAELLARHGIDGTVTHNRLDGNGTMTLTLNVKPLKIEDTMEGRMYSRLCSGYNLKPEWLGKTFRIKRDEYRLTGLNVGASRNVAKIVRVRDGSPFRCDAGTVRSGFGLPRAA